MAKVIVAEEAPLDAERARTEIKSDLTKYLEGINGDEEMRQDAMAHLRRARELQERFGTQAGEIESDPDVQAAAISAIQAKLESGTHYQEDVAWIESVRATFSVPEAIYNQPEIIEMAKTTARKTLKEYIYYLNTQDDETLEYLDYQASQAIKTAHAIQQRFNIKENDFETDPHLQAEARRTLIMRVGAVYSEKQLETIDELRTNAGLSEGVYDEPEVHAAAEESMKQSLLEYLAGVRNNDYHRGQIKVAQALRNKFQITDGKVEEDAEVQRSASQAIEHKLRQLHKPEDFEEIEQVVKYLFLPEDILKQPEFQSAAESSIGTLLQDYLQNIDPQTRTRENFGYVRRHQEPETGQLELVRIIYEKLEIQPGKEEAYLQSRAEEVIKRLIRDADEPKDVAMLQEVREGLRVPDSVFEKPEIQQIAIENAAKRMHDYVNAVSNNGTGNEELEVVEWIHQTCRIPKGEIETVPEVQQHARKTMLSMLKNWGYIDAIDRLKPLIQSEEDVYQQDDFKKAAREGLLTRLRESISEAYKESTGARRPPYEEEDYENYDGENEVRAPTPKVTKPATWEKYMEETEKILKRFQIPVEELQGNSELQSKAIDLLSYKLEHQDMGAFLKLKEGLYVPDSVYENKGVIVKAAKAIAKAASTYVWKVDNMDEDSEEYIEIQKAIALNKLFKIDNAVLDKVMKEPITDLIGQCLELGKIEQIQPLLDAFNISTEKLRSGKYEEVAQMAVYTNFQDGNRKAMEAIRDKILPDLNVDEYIRREYTKHIGESQYELAVKLKSNYPECESIYQEFITTNKTLATNPSEEIWLRRIAFDALAGLAMHGDEGCVKDFTSIIAARATQETVADSKWGLEPIQEAAFYTLMRMDTTASNQALLELVQVDNVHPTIKQAVIRKMIRKGDSKSNFLSDEVKTEVSAWLHAPRETSPDWHDLLFITEIQKIPSSELREKASKSASMLRTSGENETSLYETWRNKYHNIPQSTFLQAMELEQECGCTNLLDKFQTLYTKIRKENTQIDNLLFGITMALETSPQTKHILGEILTEVDLSSKQDAILLSDLLRQIVFLDKVDKIKPEQQPVTNEIEELVTTHKGNLGELTAHIREFATKKVQEILPNTGITSEVMYKIEQEWENLEPILTYLSRYPFLREYVAEAVAHMDTQEKWKAWRYNEQVPIRQHQIDHLTPAQLEVWKGDYFAELGDIMVAEVGSDKPQQVQLLLREAILRHRHIFNPEQGLKGNEYVAHTLENVFGEIDKAPERQSTIIAQEIQHISEDTKIMDELILHANLEKLKSVTEYLSSFKETIKTSTRLKGGTGIISAYLPANLQKALSDNYALLERGGITKPTELVTPQMMEALQKRIAELETTYSSPNTTAICEKHNIQLDAPDYVPQLYKKRQELKSAIDIMRLMDLSNKLIATNRITENEKEKGGESITSVLDRLKKYYNDSPLEQDIENIEFILKEKAEFGEKRRLAMLFTDNPQMMWQIGKYPLGNGSCQHYAEGIYAEMLMGYVGDANCKGVFLIDINKLPPDIRSEIASKGFDEVKHLIPKQDLLNASLARSIIKMERTKEDDPVILLEPTYTVLYKEDGSMDRYFNLFTDLLVADPMGVPMARGGGNVQLSIVESVNPKGQYEDSPGGVKFIHKLSRPTKEDLAVMENIRSSS